MVTTPHPVKSLEELEADLMAASDREVRERRAESLRAAGTTAHALLTGSTELKWRRPFLFIVAGAMMGAADGGLFAAIGLVALLALAYTDNTTEVVEE